MADIWLFDKSLNHKKRLRFGSLKVSGLARCSVAYRDVKAVRLTMEEGISPVIPLDDKFLRSQVNAGPEK